MVPGAWTYRFWYCSQVYIFAVFCDRTSRSLYSYRLYLVRTSIFRCAKIGKSALSLLIAPTFETCAKKMPFSLQMSAQTLADRFLIAAATTFYLCSWTEQRKSKRSTFYTGRRDTHVWATKSQKQWYEYAQRTNSLVHFPESSWSQNRIQKRLHESTQTKH